MFFTHAAECHKFFTDNVNDNVLQIERVPELNSNHEEADTRLILHAQHACITHSKVTIRSPDTDVFILMLAHKTEIRSLLIFDTGSGNNRRLIDINKVYEQLGSRLCNALIGFHDFTGCDSTSSFHGKGKVTSLKALDDCPDLYESFARFGCCFTPDSALVNALEVFVCHLYKQLTMDRVDEARFKIFSLRKYADQMPFTKDALNKHIQRSVYQAAIWKNALNATVECPNITNHGWLVDDKGNVSIDWMDLPPAPDGILQNIECSCKKGCASNRCACVKANLSCTSLCKCIDCINGKENRDELSDSEEDSEGEEDSDNELCFPR